MASRKKPEDKNLTLLRELVSQTHNKKCFDCRQRGPTYVNMTIGGFVCTSCSGLLRGLNPPHRIKSISMASFNPQEIAFLQNHGNEVCRQTWLGLWNSPLPAEPESRDEQKVKDFLVKKYERRTWYTSQPRSKSPTPVPEAKPLKHLVGDGAPKMVVDGNTSTNENHSSNSLEAASISRRTAINRGQAPAFSLLGDLGADPFGSTTSNSQQQQQPIANNTFDAFATSPTATASFDAFGQTAPQQQQPVLFDAFSSSPRQSSGSFTAFTGASAAKQSAPDFFGGMSAVVPQQATPVNGTNVPATLVGAGGDRYSALSDLDDMFRSSNTSSVFSAQANSNGPHPQQQHARSSNAQPNPFMSPASGTSGAAMFQQQQQQQQQQQRPANPFHQQSGFPSNSSPAVNMQQQQGGGSTFVQPAQQQFAASSNAPFAGVGGWGNSSMAPQQQPQQTGAFSGQNMAFGNFPATQSQVGAPGNQVMQSQQPQQYQSTMGMQMNSQFAGIPQGYQQQQPIAAGNVQQAYGQQQFQFASQQMAGFQGNQFQPGSQQTPQMGVPFNQGQFPHQQAQKMTPQQFSGWGAPPNHPSSALHQQQHQHQSNAAQQRSSTNPFM